MTNTVASFLPTLRNISNEANRKIPRFRRKIKKWSNVKIARGWKKRRRKFFVINYNSFFSFYSFELILHFSIPIFFDESNRVQVWKINFSHWILYALFPVPSDEKGISTLSRVYLEAQSCARERLHTRSSLRLSFVSADTPPPPRPLRARLPRNTPVLITF